MTVPGTILTLARQHMEAALGGLVILIVVAAIWGANVAGKHTQAAIDAGRAYSADSASRANATMDAVRAITPVRDSVAELHAVVDSLETKALPLARSEAERRTAAALIRSRLTLHADTATLHTDSGDVVHLLTSDVVQQLAAERMSTDSAFNAMERKQANDSSTIHTLTQERDGQTVEIQLDSVVVFRLRAEIALRDSTIATLQKQHAPRFTVVQGVIGGVVGTLGAILALAFAFR